MKKRSIAMGLALAGVLASTQAAAQTTRTVEGTIVGTDGTDLVVDVGTNRGASNDAVVEVWRTVRVKHPVTGAVLVDRFRIGSLKLVQARPTLSLAAPVGQGTRAPAPGDLIVLTTAATTVPPLPLDTINNKPSTAKPESAEPVDIDAAQLSALFDSLQHMPPEQRADKYDEYTRVHPTTRFFFTLREEAHALRRPAPSAPTSTAPTAPALLESFQGPTEAFAGSELEIAIELSPNAKGAVLYVRKPKGATYEALPMRARGQGYYSAKVPGALVATPSLPYFIEAIDPAGGAVPIEGTSAEPLTAPIEDAPSAPSATPVLIQLALWTDFATFNTKSFNDYVSQTEGLFGARFRDVGVRAVRTGFGVYRGVGGTLDELDRFGVQHDVGLTYGYLETELAPSQIFAFVGRGVLGLGQNGTTAGMQLFMRIGNDLRTNLLIGGEALGGVGVRGITELDWLAQKRVPIMFRAEVTNQPAGSANGDIGVRLIAQAGYRVTEGLTLALRASYQGRTINHAGPGGGAAVMYQW